MRNAVKYGNHSRKMTKARGCPTDLSSRARPACYGRVPAPDLARVCSIQ